MQGDQRGTGHRKSGFGTGRNGVASVSTLAGAGIELALCIVLFLFVGKWLDARFGTTPVLMIIGVFVGAAGGIYSLYRVMAAQQARSTGPGERPHEK